MLGPSQGGHGPCHVGRPGESVLGQEAGAGWPAVQVEAGVGGKSPRPAGSERTELLQGAASETF